MMEKMTIELLENLVQQNKPEITASEIDETIRNANILIMNTDLNMMLSYFIGLFSGKDIERNSLKCSAPGESDWLRLVLRFQRLEILVRQRFQAWLSTHKEVDRHEQQ